MKTYTVNTVSSLMRAIDAYAYDYAKSGKLSFRRIELEIGLMQAIEDASNIDKPVEIKLHEAPSVLNTSDKAMYVLGWNALVAKLEKT